MSGLDLTKVNAAEEEIKARNAGAGAFVRLSKGESKDIRILEPTAAMNGLYWIEVPIWWVNGKPLNSPEILEKEGDLIQEIIDEYEALFKKDKAEAAFDKLMKASKGPNQKLIQKQTAFWIPILEFEWKLNDKGTEILGITKDNEYDASLIKEFIKGGEAKVFDVRQSLLSSINRQLTTGRKGANFMDQEKGFNLIVSRKGEGRDTKYEAVADEQMPMPAEFYGEGSLDLFKIAKASLHTVKYIEDVLSNYFEGTPLPENPEYRFPELREELKSGSEEEASPTRSRRRAATEEAQTEPEANEPASEPEATEAAPKTTRSRGAKTEGEAAPTRQRKSRSLTDDVADKDK